MNILMEKKKSEGIKGWLRVEKALLTIHFLKIEFGEELGELARVSAGNPFQCSDSAVKLSALAVRLEEPFRFLICRDWYRDSKNFIDESISLVDLARRGIFLLARVGGLIVFLSWAHLLLLLSVCTRVASFIDQGVASLLVEILSL
jgi:hypothetical protein